MRYFKNDSCRDFCDHCDMHLSVDIYTCIINKSIALINFVDLCV